MSQYNSSYYKDLHVHFLNLTSDCKSYAAKLEHHLKWAYEAAQKYIDKETTRYKKYYDKNFHCAILRKGDLINIVRINKFGTDHKIADKWEQDPWEVLSQKDDSPLLTIKNVTTNEIRELHRNMLFPLRLVDPEGHQKDETMTQIKANRCLLVYLWLWKLCGDSLVLEGEGIGVPPKQ